MGRVYQPALAINATPGAFLAALGDEALSGENNRQIATAAAHAEYMAWQAPRPVPGDVDMWQVAQWLDARLPDDVIITNGAGNYSTWMHRLFSYRALPLAVDTLLGADGLRGSGGVSPRRRSTGRVVVSWNGDGCFPVNGQELAPAVQYGLAIDLLWSSTTACTG